MNKLKLYQGWIYCITNKINGKRYIGQTIDFNTRRKRHLKYTSDENSILHSAIRKYGPSNFDIKIIVTFKAISEGVRRKLLDFLEMLYIRKYQTLTTQNGYNITAGGGGMSGFHPSERSKKKMSESQKSSIVCVSNWKTNQYDARRPVLLYDLKGKFYKEYDSITDALNSLGKSVKPIRESVFKALKDQTKSSYGYLWKYKDSDNYPELINSWSDPQWKTVYYYSKEGKLLDVYNCAREAAEELGVKLRTVKSSLERPSTKRRKRVSNYWSYTPPLDF